MHFVISILSDLNSIMEFEKQDGESINILVKIGI